MTAVVDLNQPEVGCLAWEGILKEHSWSESAPEAIHCRGVTRYKSTHNSKPLKDAYEELVSRYPESEWTRRAYPLPPAVKLNGGDAERREPGVGESPEPVCSSPVSVFLASLFSVLESCPR